MSRPASSFGLQRGLATTPASRPWRTVASGWRPSRDRRSGTRWRRRRARSASPRPGGRAGVDAGCEQRRAAREERAVVVASRVSAVMRGASTREEDVGVGADLFEHLDAGFDRRRAVGYAKAASSKHSGRMPSTTRVVPGRPAVSARGGRGYCPKHDVVVRRSRLDEVHRRRADERCDEQVARLVVERLRRVDLKDLPVPHHRHALPERHRLHLVVRDVDGRDAEPCVQLRRAMRACRPVASRRGSRAARP